MLISQRRLLGCFLLPSLLPPHVFYPSLLYGSFAPVPFLYIPLLGLWGLSCIQTTLSFTQAYTPPGNECAIRGSCSRVVRQARREQKEGEQR